MSGFAGYREFKGVVTIVARTRHDAARVVERMDRAFTVSGEAPYVVVSELREVEPGSDLSMLPPTQDVHRTCVALIADGSRRCRQVPQAGSDYCRSHDPARAEERRKQLDRARKVGRS